MTGWYDVRSAATLAIRPPRHFFLADRSRLIGTAPAATSRRSALTVFSSPLRKYSGPALGVAVCRGAEDVSCTACLSFRTSFVRSYRQLSICW